MGLDRQAEQVARPVRYKGLDGLRPAGGDLDDVPVVRVDGQDVTVRCDDQAERAVQGAARGHGQAGAVVAEAEHRVGDGGDPVRQRVGDVQGAVRAESDAGRADDERRRVQVLGEAGADLGDRQQARQPEGSAGDDEPQHRAPVDGVAARGDGAVQHVGDEQLGQAAQVKGGHVPGAVDAVAGERLADDAVTVQDDQAAGAGDAAVLGGQRPDDHPAAAQHHQGGGQADAARAGAVGDPGEL